MSRVLAPTDAEANAAAMPAGPPPQTITSVDSVRGVCLAGSWIMFFSYGCWDRVSYISPSGVLPVSDVSGHPGAAPLDPADVSLEETLEVQLMREVAGRSLVVRDTLELRVDAYAQLLLEGAARVVGATLGTVRGVGNLS